MTLPFHNNGLVQIKNGMVYCLFIGELLHLNTNEMMLIPLFQECAGPNLLIEEFISDILGVRRIMAIMGITLIQLHNRFAQVME